MNVHHGVIKAVDWNRVPDGDQLVEKVRNALVDQRMQDIGSWTDFLQSRIQPWDDKYDVLAKQLEELLPIPKLR